VIEGRIDTGYLDRHLDEFLGAGEADDPQAAFAAATAWLLHEEDAAARNAAASADPHSPWARADGWRLGHRGKRIVMLNHAAIEAHGSGGHYVLATGATTCAIAGARFDGATLSARFGDDARRFQVAIDGDRVVVHDGERRRTFEHTPPFAFEKSEDAGADNLRAPMPGRIVLVKTAPGAQVKAGQELLVIEAMKMELSLKAPQDAVVASLHANAGEFVEADTVLVRFGERQ
jgi:3-methylcrotonyl-CoA carboxylase alpha subunit